MKRGLENAMKGDRYSDDEITAIQQDISDVEDYEDLEVTKEVQQKIVTDFLINADTYLIIINKGLQNYKESLDRIKICRRLLRNDKSVVEIFDIYQLRSALNIILKHPHLNTFPDNDPANLYNVDKHKFRPKKLSHLGLLSTLDRFYKYNNLSKHVISYSLLNYCSRTIGIPPEVKHEIYKFDKKFGKLIKVHEDIFNKITKIIFAYQDIEYCNDQLLRDLATEVIDTGFKCLSLPIDRTNRYSPIQRVGNIFEAAGLLGISDDFHTMYTLTCAKYQGDEKLINKAMRVIIDYYIDMSALDKADIWIEQMKNVERFYWKITQRNLLRLAIKRYKASDIQGAVNDCYYYLAHSSDNDDGSYDAVRILINIIHKGRAHYDNYSSHIVSCLIDLVRSRKDFRSDISNLLDCYDLWKLFSRKRDFSMKGLLIDLGFFEKPLMYSITMAQIYLEIANSNEECFSQFKLRFLCNSHDEKEWINSAELLLKDCTSRDRLFIPFFLRQNPIILSRIKDFQQLLDARKCLPVDADDCSNKPR